MSTLTQLYVETYLVINSMLNISKKVIIIMKAKLKEQVVNQLLLINVHLQRVEFQMTQIATLFCLFLCHLFWIYN